MEKHSSIGVFLLNFAMQEGNNTQPQSLLDVMTHSLKINLLTL